MPTDGEKRLRFLPASPTLAQLATPVCSSPARISTCRTVEVGTHIPVNQVVGEGERDDAVRRVQERVRKIALALHIHIVDKALYIQIFGVKVTLFGKVELGIRLIGKL